MLPITDKDVTQVNGVTFTKNGDGTCTVNGTASSVAWYRLGSDFTVPAGTYTISDGTVSNNQSHFSDDNLTAGYNYSEKITVTYDSEHIFKPYIRINVGSVLNNVTSNQCSTWVQKHYHLNPTLAVNPHQVQNIHRR